MGLALITMKIFLQLFVINRGTGDLNTLIISGSQGDEDRNLYYGASIFLVENVQVSRKRSRS